jgi:tetratricopeptide (TPR) repeat protein
LHKPQPWLLPASFAAISFVGGIASNLVANAVDQTFRPYIRWVTVLLAIAFVVSILAAVREARRARQSPSDDQPDLLHTTVTGSGHSVGHQAGRDLTVTQITNPHYFLEQARRADPHSQPFDYATYEDAQWGDLKTDDVLEFLRLARVQIQEDFNQALSPKEQFERFGFVSNGARPTYGASLCFGEQPNKILAGCGANCHLWKGKGETGLLDSQSFRGNLFSQYNGALAFLKKNLRFERSFDAQGRSDDFDLPIQAIEEALANALVHREYQNRTDWVRVNLYDDKLEIISPGSLPQQVTLDTIKAEDVTYPRNPLIARIFYLFGKVERTGKGITRMTEAMRSRGLPDPALEVVPPDSFKVTLFRQLFAAIHQLPPPPHDFTGREQELKELLAATERGVVISGLQGLGGVGKTALALKLAERLKDRYPDAQFYLDLRGVSERPVTPAEAMAHVIRAYHPTAQLPESEAELRPLFHSVLHGQGALLLMDNAKDKAQVEPLIPPAGCMLLVTSRQHFKLPGMFDQNLDTLPRADAIKLLLNIAGRIGDHADEIARLCGDLPLALRVAAGALAERPNLAPADYVRQLVDAKQRLSRLKEVDVALNVSYEMLNQEQRRWWRALSVFPQTFDDEAAAVVWEVARDAAQDALGELMKWSLVEFSAKTERYRLHNLARLFAESCLAADERDALQQCHARYYRAVLAQADDLYLKGNGNLTRGLQLFDQERVNIETGFAWAAAHAEQDDKAARLCIEYPNAGAYVLDLRLHPRERIAWLEAAVASAQRLGQRQSEGSALANLGLALADLGGTRQAIEHYESALSLHRESGDRRAEGAALGNLGSACAALGETRKAIEFYERYLAIAREISDRRSEGNALGNLGSAYFSLGEIRHAVEFYEQRLVIAREIGDRRGEGAALGNLGIAYESLGEAPRAVEYHQQYLAIAREIGDRRGEGNALFNLSLALDDLGERSEAIAHASAALRIFEQIEDPNAAKVREHLAAWHGQQP